MTRLSLLIGLFLATTVTSIIILMAAMGRVAGTTMLYRGTVIFFIFGFLGTFFGSFLEVLFMPAVTERESMNLRKEMSGEDKELKAELGDLLEEHKINVNQSENGTLTNESRSGTAINGSKSTVAS